MANTSNTVYLNIEKGDNSMNVNSKLKNLYEQMEGELYYLNPEEKQNVKKFMLFAFERGQKSILEKYLRAK